MKEFALQLQVEVQKAKHILLHCHVSPDSDSIGSALAMKLALEQLGKKVTVIQGDDAIPTAFAFPGVETIVKKNFFEIDIKDFDLFIILDTGSLDRISMKSEIVFPPELMTIVIDHHISNPGYGKINWIDPKYPSVTSMLYDLFEQIGVKLDHDIALNLFMGIYTDTGAFRHGINSSLTLAKATELAKLAPDFQKTISIMENSNRKEGLVFEGLGLSSFRTFLNGEVAISSVSHEDMVKNNIFKEDTSGGYISNKIKSVKGVMVGFTLIEIEKDVIRVSGRSNNPSKYNIAKLAEVFGGGGHAAAAGFYLKIPLPEAIDKVVKTVKKIYNL